MLLKPRERPTAIPQDFCAHLGRGASTVLATLAASRFKFELHYNASTATEKPVSNTPLACD
jgi:hypothetical protein